MLLESIYKRYMPGLKPPDGYEGSKLWLVFEEGKLLTKALDNKISLPCCKSLEEINIQAMKTGYLGTFDGQPCFWVDAYPAGLQEGMEFRWLRSLLGIMDEGLFLLAGRAMQIIYWDRTTRFCGRCGAENTDKEDERAKLCTKCGNIIYPRISPAIIVAVIKEDKLLLAHARHFDQGMYSVIAGFVEPGETFEDCVKREVMEEVGIKVKSLKYFGSQPWPFPDSLMVAFTAEYQDGEISADGTEIEDAGWYHKDELPKTPSGTSVAGRMINWFIENF